MKIEIVNFVGSLIATYKYGALDHHFIPIKSLDLYIDGFMESFVLSTGLSGSDFYQRVASTAARGFECEMPPNNWPARWFK